VLEKPAWGRADTTPERARRADAAEKILEDILKIENEWTAKPTKVIVR